MIMMTVIIIIILVLQLVMIINNNNNYNGNVNKNQVMWLKKRFLRLCLKIFKLQSNLSIADMLYSGHLVIAVTF